ncbi:MAG: hypothetical protein WHS89_02715 [Acidimicrobiales bacterium]
MKTKLTLVGGAALLASTFALGSPASAGITTFLTVVKDVEGTPPADAEFVIEVTCVLTDLPVPTGLLDEQGGLAAAGDDTSPYYGDTFTFGPDGGEESLPIPGPSECTITETDDGGADDVIGGEQTVTFSDPESQTVTVTNVFNAETTTIAPTTSAPASTSTTAAAAATTAAPRFTG